MTDVITVTIKALTERAEKAERERDSLMNTLRSAKSGLKSIRDAPDSVFRHYVAEIVTILEAGAIKEKSDEG